MMPQFISLGLENFLELQKIQDVFLEERKKNLCPDTILLFQSYPVITLGRSSGLKDILIDRDIIEQEGISVLKLNRGGGVTVHMPGQLIAYPIIDLSCFKKDISAFLSFLEDWIIYFLGLCGIEAARRGSLSGVWVKNKKICFIGIGVSRWISFHGLSLNINPDLKYFSYINPCGMKGIEVTSLYQETGILPPENEIIKNLKTSFVKTAEANGNFYADRDRLSSLAGKEIL